VFYYFPAFSAEKYKNPQGEIKKASCPEKYIIDTGINISLELSIYGNNL
jgi:hypothetical protein